MILRKDFVLNIEDTLMCGQAFRWHSESNGFLGVVGGTVVHIIKDPGEGIIFETSAGDEEGNFDPESYFRFQDDLNEIYTVLRSHPRMEDIITHFHGMRLLRQEPFETLLSYILSQNSNIPRISHMVEMLSREYGSRLMFHGQTFDAFPTPQQLSRVRISTYRKMGMGYRAPYIHNAVAGINEGNLELEELRKQSYPSVKERLMELPGVGHKVADCVCLFSMDKLEAFPVDRWMKKVVSELMFGVTNPNEEMIREWGMKRFGRYAGYAQQYLFHAIRKRS